MNTENLYEETVEVTRSQVMGAMANLIGDRIDDHERAHDAIRTADFAVQEIAFRAADEIMEALGIEQ